MAISWLSVLQAVPWSDVISKAPRIAEGARKLWATSGGRADAQSAATGPAPAVDAAAGEGQPLERAIAQWGGRTQALETEVAGLHAQLRQTSELLNALAEQNAELVQRVELNRVRLQRALLLAGVAAAAAASALAWHALR